MEILDSERDFTGRPVAFENFKDAIATAAS
jgi:hypothetical protein